MDAAPADSRPGPVQLCVGECRPELKARSSQLYSFVVWLQLHHTASVSSCNITYNTYEVRRSWYEINERAAPNNVVSSIKSDV